MLQSNLSYFSHLTSPLPLPRTQFIELYPLRRELLLLPRNEAGVKKFVCTTIRPTQMPYKDLYEVDACAKFLADFLVYEPLEDPTHLPP